MQEAVPVGKGSMLAVLGTDIEKIKSLLTSNELDKKVCEIANDNAIGQVIVSGKQKVCKCFKLF